MGSNSENKPFFKKWWFWAIVAVVGIGAVGSAVGGNKKSTNVSITSEQSQNTIFEPLQSADSESSFSEVESDVDRSKTYTIDEFCSFFENDKDFAYNHGDLVFTISGSVENKWYSSVEFNSSFESEKWNNNYTISCKFNGKEAIKDINEGATATISGSLFSLATSGIVLDDCTVVSFENPAEDISKTETSLTEDILETEASSIEDVLETEASLTEDVRETEEPEPSETIAVIEQATEVSTTTKPAAETKQPVTWETVGDKKAEKTYVLNTHTMKIHIPGCSSVKDIKPENYAETDDYDAAISQGYKPCGRCHAS